MNLNDLKMRFAVVDSHGNERSRHPDKADAEQAIASAWTRAWRHPSADARDILKLTIIELED